MSLFLKEILVKTCITRTLFCTFILQYLKSLFGFSGFFNCFGNKKGSYDVFKKVLCSS